jgi:hypothetical protein
MKSPSVLHLTMLVSSVFLLAACTTSATRFPVQRYVPVGREIEPLGELDLSNSLMRFGGLEGEMKLKYVGQMPESAGEDMLGASVYEVKNAQPYFKKNTGRKAYCTVAPRWVAVNSKTGAPAWSNEITVSLLTLEDWQKYRPIAYQSCAGGTYVRAQD